MRFVTPCITVLLTSATLATGYQQPSEDAVTSRLMPDRLVVRAPLGSCTVARVAALIAKSVAIPAGAERLPGPCTPDALEWAATDVVHLQGMTVADAMNAVVKLDPRYYWTESDGVVVVRPLAAWANPKHFLHDTLEALELDKVNIGAALDAVLRPLRGERPEGAGLLMRDVGELSISVGPITMTEALDAIVRAHGRARWEVTYCRPEAMIDYAIVWIYTFDDRGIGTPARIPRDATGKTYDPCRSQN